MPPKKKGGSGRKQEGGVIKNTESPNIEKEAQLQQEYDLLTETLASLKRKVERLRCENDFLQKETDQTRAESQEYMSYIAKRTHKRQTAIVTLGDQNHAELEALKKQREEAVAKYQGQANDLRKGILERENELALLNMEIAELREFKSLQQQQLARLAELEAERSSMQHLHADTLQGLKAHFLFDKERYERQVKHKVQALTLAANREASRCLHSHTREVSEENQRLRSELLVLIGRAQALRRHQEHVQAQHQALLLERDYVRELQLLRAALPPPRTGGATTPEPEATHRP